MREKEANMQIKVTKVTNADRVQNVKVAKANAKAARELRRKADAKLAYALSIIDSMDAHESAKAQDKVHALAHRYEGCTTHRQVDAVYYDEQEKGKNIEWFAAINAAFRSTAHARLAA